MPLDTTQVGAVGEQLFAAYLTLTSNGDLQLFRPLSDVDHTDISAGLRGRVPALSIQVKTSLRLNRKRRVQAIMTFGGGIPLEHPAFLYSILFVEKLAITHAWLIPSADFNRLAYHHRTPSGHLALIFEAAPDSDERWHPWRVDPSQLGPGVLKVINSLPSSPPPLLTGAFLIAPT